MAGNLIARSVHDLTAAAWFGGSLMGAIGLNGAAAEAKDPAERTRLSSKGWGKWAPIQTAAFAGHLVADLAIAWENKGRIAKQDNVAANTVYKTAVTLAGAAVTLYAGIVGKKVDALADQGAEGATEPRAGASDELKSAQIPAESVAVGHSCLRRLGDHSRRKTRRDAATQEHRQGPALTGR